MYECKLIQSGNLAGLKEREKCGLTGGNGSCPPPLRLNLTTGKTKLHLLVCPCAQLLITHAACASCRIWQKEHFTASKYAYFLWEKQNAKRVVCLHVLYSKTGELSKYPDDILLFWSAHFTILRGHSTYIYCTSKYYPRTHFLTHVVCAQYVISGAASV